MAKKLTIRVESREGTDGVSCTEVRTYNDTLARIYFLEDEDGHGFHYCIQWDWGWDENEFTTELAAVAYICDKCGFMAKYDSLPLRYGYYSNSEDGAIRFDKDIDLRKL